VVTVVVNRIASRCVLSPAHTALAALLWLALPGCGLLWLAAVIGPDPLLLYPAGVTLVPAGLALAGPWLRAAVGYREEVNGE
jgi:hypothetical protein